MPTKHHYLGSWIAVMVRIGLVLLNFLGELLTNVFLRHLLAHSGIELAHL